MSFQDDMKKKAANSKEKDARRAEKNKTWGKDQPADKKGKK